MVVSHTKAFLNLSSVFTIRGRKQKNLCHLVILSSRPEYDSIRIFIINLPIRSSGNDSFVKLSVPRSAFDFHLILVKQFRKSPEQSKKNCRHERNNSAECSDKVSDIEPTCAVSNPSKHQIENKQSDECKKRNCGS